MSTGFVINQRVGVVHRDSCAALARMRPGNLSPWDPTKAHLAPGVVYCPVCEADAALDAQ